MEPGLIWGKSSLTCEGHHPLLPVTIQSNGFVFHRLETTADAWHVLWMETFSVSSPLYNNCQRTFPFVCSLKFPKLLVQTCSQSVTNLLWRIFSYNFQQRNSIQNPDLPAYFHQHAYYTFCWYLQHPKSVTEISVSGFKKLSFEVMFHNKQAILYTDYLLSTHDDTLQPVKNVTSKFQVSSNLLHEITKMFIGS